MKFVNRNLICDSSLHSPWLIFTATTLGVMMVTIDANIVNVALPVITQDYAVNIAKAQWVVSSYILITCILLPVCGRLSDIYTKRWIYLLGFAIFTFSSALCSIANSLTALVVYRLLQGIGGAMIMSNTQALIAMNFPRELQGRALSVNSMSASFGAIVGPALGGFLLSILSWRSIFYINIPIGIVGCLVGYYVLPCNEERVSHSLDIIGSVLFAVIITCILLMLDNCGQAHWLTWPNLVLLLISCIAGWFFIKRQRQVSNPVLDLSLFKNSMYLNSNIAAFIVFTVLGGNSILLPFYLHDILKLTFGVIGMLMFVLPCVMLILAPLSGYLADKFSSRIFLVLGLVLFMLGLFLQGSVSMHTKLWEIVTCQIILGCGFALFHPPNNVALFKNVALIKFGVAGSINALMRSMGRGFGVVLVTTIFSLLFKYMLKAHHPASHNIAFLFGFRMAFYSLGICVLVALHYSIKAKIVETPNLGVSQ